MLMRSRQHIFISLFVVAVVALSACGQGSETDALQAVSPTVGTVTSPGAEPAASTGSGQGPSEPTLVPDLSATANPAQAPVAIQTMEPPLPESPMVPDVIEGTGGDKAPGAAVVTLSPLAEELPTVEVVKILTPSVVQIVTEVAGMGFLNDPSPQSGVGTGVVLDTNGHILTNNHVVSGAQRITATLSDGRSFSARVVGTDERTDLAVIRVDAINLVLAMLGESSRLQVGQDVIAIGHALGLAGGPTVSKGVVSALGRTIDTDQQNTIIDLIQTDTSINPGNSGGPLVNNSAEVMGINTAIFSGSQGIGFAINIDDAKEVASQLIAHGVVRRGFLGITPINLTPGLAMQLGLPVTEGILIIRVYVGTAAAAAGLVPEDIIIELGGDAIRNTGELAKFLMSHQPRETVDIVIVREGIEISGEVTLIGRPN
jgi:S1-C subfamily serine protease